MPRALYLPKIIKFSSRAINKAKFYLFNSFLLLKQSLKVGLPSIALISALSACTKPGSIHLTYDQAENWDIASKNTFKLQCPHIQNVTPAEQNKFAEQLRLLNPGKSHPRDSFLGKLRGTNLVPPACPERFVYKTPKTKTVKVVPIIARKPEPKKKNKDLVKLEELVKRAEDALKPQPKKTKKVYKPKPKRVVTPQ